MHIRIVSEGCLRGLVSSVTALDFRPRHFSRMETACLEIIRNIVHYGILRSLRRETSADGQGGRTPLRARQLREQDTCGSAKGRLRSPPRVTTPHDHPNSGRLEELAVMARFVKEDICVEGTPR